MLVRAVAPIRVADLGGWTDTWFAGHGAVCHVAVLPGVEVQVRAGPRTGPRLVVNAVNLGERVVVDEDDAWRMRQPLLAAALDEAMPDAPGLESRGFEVTIASAIPPGASTGTSASLVVALLAAFGRLAGPEIDRTALARRAHGVEVVRLGQQSGVQDQIAAACGGIGYVEIAPYPGWTRTPVDVSHATREALAERLALIYLGAAHASSEVHESVIRSLQDGRGEGTAGTKAALQRLRDAARAGRDALAAGDLEAYGRALLANTDAQALLHPALVSDAAREVFSLAARHGAAGWKVNGAGGDGGSVTVLAPARVSAREAFMHAVATELRGATAIPLTLAEGGVATSVEAV